MAAARNDASWNATPQVAKKDLEDLRVEFRKQISDMRREIMGAIGRNAPQTSGNTAKAVITEDERQSQVNDQRTPCSGCCNSQVECSARVESTRRPENLKLLKRSDKKHLTVHECAGHQLTNELESETHQSIVSLLVYVAHFRNLWHYVEEKSIARSLKAKRSNRVHLAN